MPKKDKRPRTIPAALTVEVSSDFTPDGEVILIPLEQSSHTPPLILLSSRDAGRAKPGDQFLVRIRRLPKQDFHVAQILKKLHKTSPQWVGLVTRSRKQLVVTPSDRKRQRESIPLEPQAKAKAGDIILVDATRKVGTVVKNLGSLDDPHVISLMAIYEQNIPHEFSPEVLKEAEKVATLSLLEGREDLRHIPFVTIDGEDARDFDDAVWAQYDEAEGWHLMVAIADVSYYVSPDSLLDQEAFQRGNSVYFPDRVVPMLPEALSAGACSLRPHEDKACLAVHLWLDIKGRLKKYEFVRGVMQSHARLTYAQIQKAIDGNADDQTKPLLEGVLHPLYKAYGILKQARDDRGTLDLDIRERQIVMDDSGHITDIQPRFRLDSHRLIEEFMILANVAAAQQLESLKAPCLYRVHEAPDLAKIFAFRDVVEGMGFSFPLSKGIKPENFVRLLATVQDTPHQDLVNQLTLRTQAQALYHPENKGHFGLNLKKYAHFTSPIRRYADLVIHRNLCSVLKFTTDPVLPNETLLSVGEQTSRTERRAAIAERTSLERYITLYLKDKVGETFPGRISGVGSFGLFVTLDHSGADGLIPIASLNDDFYVYEEKQHRLIGRRKRRTYTLADLVKVTLREVDTLTNTLRFVLEEEDRPSGSSGKKHRPKKSRS